MAARPRRTCRPRCWRWTGPGRRIGVAGGGHAQAARGGVHPRHERGLAAGVPAREYPGQFRPTAAAAPQRLALGERLPGGDGHQRVAGANLRRVGGRLRRLDPISGRSSAAADGRAGSRTRSSAWRRWRWAPAGSRPGRHHAVAAEAAAETPSAGHDPGQPLPARRPSRPADVPGHVRPASRAGPEGDGCQVRQGKTGQAGEGGQQRQDSPAPRYRCVGRAGRARAGCVWCMPGGADRVLRLVRRGHNRVTAACPPRGGPSQRSRGRL